MHAVPAPQKFRSDAARIRYARRVADAIIEGMFQNTTYATLTVLRGRIGLAQMSDTQLVELGVEAWGVQPTLDEVLTLH